MTLLTDANEPAAVDLYVQKLGVDTQRMLLNRPAAIPRPDYGFYLPDGSYMGVSRKQCGEFVAGIDACEAQLMDEMDGCHYMALLIEGRMGPAPDGGTYAYSYGKEVIREREGVGYGTTETVRRHYRQPYKGVRQKLARFWDLGIHVIESHDIEDTAACLVALHNELQKPEAALTTFKRLIPEKYRLDEADADRKRFCLQLMQSVPGGGEELGHALYDAGFRTLHQLVRCFDPWETVPLMDWQAISALPLRSGKRSVGKAAVERIRKALGC